MQYRWTPRWQYLDRDDLLHFFCLLKIRVSGAQMEDREFPPRLKRQFTRKGNGWFFEGRVSNLEYDDIGYLSKFLKIELPQDAVEVSSFSNRIRAHLTQNEAGNYDWTPDTRRMDCEDVPHVLPWLDFSVGEDRFLAGNFPMHLRCHFTAAKEAA